MRSANAKNSCVRRKTFSCVFFWLFFCLSFHLGFRLFRCWFFCQAFFVRFTALVALTALAEHELALSSPMTAITYARRQLALESWQEAAHRQLMRAHLQMGQIHLARQQYETCAQVLKK